jgi:ligand-binding sensor domain-containing protein/signal transduction histidine kinase
MRIRAASTLALMGVAVAFASPSEASPPGPVAYSRRVWQSADGLPEDFAQALAQTRDGYLWIGTSGGLVRFDGMRFTVFNRENEPAFRDDSIYSLLTSSDGALWIGSEGGGLIRYRDRAFQVFDSSEGLTNGFVRVIFEDSNRRLWVGTDDGLFRMEHDALVRIDGKAGVPRMAVHSICQDREGRLLIGGSGLLVLTGKAAVYYRSAKNLADNSIRAIRQTRDGAVWIGTISGLRKLERGLQSDPFLTPQTISDRNISYLLEGRDGQLWIGTYGQGLMRYAEGRKVALSAPSTLPHNNVLAIFEDSEDDIWVGTQGGLLRLSPSAASTITAADGVPQSINTIYQDPAGPLYITALNGRLFRASAQALELVPLPSALSGLRVRNLFRDSRGALWIGTDGQGVAKIAGGQIQGGEAVRFTMKQGLVNDFTRAFCEDRNGSIWIGTDGGVSRWREGAFQNFNTQDGLAYGSIRALMLDRNGSLWIATDGGLSHFRDGAFVRDPLLERLHGEKIWALFQDADGGLWIGANGAGLFRLADGRLTQFTTKQGLPSNKIHFLAEDTRNNLWMSGPNGIVSVSRRELDDRSRDPSGRLAVHVYSTSEGLSTNQMNGGVQPAGTLSLAGEIWFGSAKGAVRIDPDVPDRGSLPPVAIEEVVADDRPVSFDSGVHVGPGKGKLEVRYTAIRLRSPERTQFKYWMEGFDREWTDAGQRRVAYYTNLPAGRYRFHAVAFQRNDPRSAAEQILSIEWQPHFYRTFWFLAFCAMAAVAFAWLSYQVHVRNIRKRFAAVIEERNRLAREMHDTLIQGCVGVSTLLEAASGARDVSPRLSGELLERARSEVRATVEEARLAVWNLRQNDETCDDLAAAVSDLTRRVGLETGIPVRFEREGAPLVLRAESQRSVLLLIREALHNAVRHGAPKHLTVILDCDGGAVDVRIEDDGCGFDPSTIHSMNGHYGLIGMRERIAKLGGQFCLTSAPGSGTQVRLTIPARKPAAGETLLN